MKKLMNNADDFVKEMIEGVYLANKDKYEYVPEINTLYRKDIPANKVAIMQGSGSGHEPAHIMSVGKGMLDAACPGAVFAAPPMNYVYECTKKIETEAGFTIAKNYVGNYCTSLEMAGFSLTILQLDDEIEELLNEPAEIAIRVF